MRTTTAARLGVATTAFALALSLGASTAIAEDTGTKTAELGMVKPDTGAAKTKISTTKQLSKTQLGKASISAADEPSITAETDPDITSYNQKTIILDQPGTFVYRGYPVVTNPQNVYVLNPHLTVNGTDRGTRELAFKGALPPYLDSDTGEELEGLIINSNSPVGQARLGPTEIYTQTDPTTPEEWDGLDPIIDPTLGGTFYIKRATGSTAVSKPPFQIYRNGGKIKFTANSWKIFQPSTGTYVPLGSIKLQYKRSDGSYSTLKTMSLNSYGNGYYWRTDSKKRRYRLLISTTNTAQGSYTLTSGLI